MEKQNRGFDCHMVSLFFYFRVPNLFVHLSRLQNGIYLLTRYSEINSLVRIKTLLAVILFCITFPSLATGPSSARILINPVTYNDKGVVLFKAYQEIAYSGGASDRKFSYWWLVVSASGVWEEVPHKILKQPEYSQSNAKNSLEKEERKQTDFWKRVNFYSDESLDWGRPPRSLLPLIKKYGFKPRPSFNANEGQDTVTWSSKGLCTNGKCTKTTIPQRTLGKRSSSEAYKNIESKGEELIEVESMRIQNIFYHAGVALFRNGNYKIVDGKYEETIDIEDDSIGAMFDFHKKEMGDQIIDYDYIDAISIVPKRIK